MGDREWQWKMTRCVRNNGECNVGVGDKNYDMVPMG